MSRQLRNGADFTSQIGDKMERVMERVPFLVENGSRDSRPTEGLPLLFPIDTKVENIHCVPDTLRVMSLRDF